MPEKKLSLYMHDLQSWKLAFNCTECVCSACCSSRVPSCSRELCVVQASSTLPSSATSVCCSFSLRGTHLNQPVNLLTIRWLSLWWQFTLHLRHCSDFTSVNLIVRWSLPRFWTTPRSFSWARSHRCLQLLCPPVNSDRWPANAYNKHRSVSTHCG